MFDTVADDEKRLRRGQLPCNSSVHGQHGVPLFPAHTAKGETIPGGGDGKGDDEEEEEEEHEQKQDEEEEKQEEDEDEDEELQTSWEKGRIQEEEEEGGKGPPPYKRWF